MNFTVEQDRISLSDYAGKLLAEVTFPAIDNSTVNINHTFVDDSLRGQGIAGQLMQKAADVLKMEKKKILPTCSYAVKWFQKHPEYADIVVKSTEGESQYGGNSFENP